VGHPQVLVITPGKPVRDSQFLFRRESITYGKRAVGNLREQCLSELLMMGCCHSDPYVLLLGKENVIPND